MPVGKKVAILVFRSLIKPISWYSSTLQFVVVAGRPCISFKEASQTSSLIYMQTTIPVFTCFIVALVSVSRGSNQVPH
jgi:hypothetical protein